MKPSKLTYHISGTGRNIVLIHGWGMHSGIWLDLANKLAKSHRVTIFDLPGYGNNMEFYDCSKLEDISEAILDIIPKQSILLGWSMGGLIAMWIAIYHPLSVNKLILTNSTPCFIEKHNWAGISRKVLEQFKESLTKDVSSTITRFITLQLNIMSYQDAKWQLSLMKTIMLAKNLPSADFLINNLDILSAADLRPQLSAIQSPIIYLLGRADRLVPTVVKTNLSNYLPQAQIKIFSDAGHIPFISHPATFLETITNFIYEK